MKLKVFTMFSGYDSQCMALDRLKEMHPDFDYELVGWAEIDKYAILAHNAVYPQWSERNYGDVSKIDWSKVPDFDLLTYSSPCQDFSNAGLQRGGQEGSGTRSSLLWECRRAIVTKEPKYLMMENVAALVSQKFIGTFNQWQLELERYGYTNFAQVLNAKDYGVPQNRERIFMISILDCEDAYYFPKKMKLTKRLKDVLEENVDEKYYLSDKMLEGFMMHNEKHQTKGTGFLFEPTDGGGGTAKCLRANAALAPTDNAIIDTTKPIGGGQFLEFKNFISRGDQNNSYNRVWKEEAYCGTLNCTKEMEVLVSGQTDRGGQNEPINVDAEGNAKCLKACHFKAGAANFKEREDGFAQTAVKVNNKDDV